MDRLRRALDRSARHFEKGGRLERLRALYDAVDTFLYTPADVTGGSTHVRDALDLKRMMITVVIALIPCTLMAMYNTGLQANLALDPADIANLPGWRHELLRLFGIGYSPDSTLACFIHGALYFLPLYIITMVVGLGWEILFAQIRGHEVNEGFFVTGLIFPLILPPTTPLWQAALAISWGVVLAKEVFGGTGMNILNPALVARAFLFYAYPADITGDKVWVAAQAPWTIDSYSSATILSTVQQKSGMFDPEMHSWWNAFTGFEPGSMGETSALACLLGAAILLYTRVASWRTMTAVVIGTVLASSFFNWLGSGTNAGFTMPFWWHMVAGGWAFGAVFMVTDPVTSAFTNTGKWIYGIMIGILVVVIRVTNPAFPEAMMLVILFMNVFAPLIDYYVVKGNVRRRLRRSEN